MPTAVDGRTRPVGRTMTADLRALCPPDTEDQTVVRPLTCAWAKSRYEPASSPPMP